MNYNPTQTNFAGVSPPGEESCKMIEAVLRYPVGSVLDLGTGTGFIGVSLALKDFEVEATDINNKALENAKKNAQLAKVSIKIFYSDLFDHIHRKYDFILFNPPRNPDEGLLTRLIISIIKKYPPLVNLILPLAQLIFGNKRRQFLLSFINNAQTYLNLKGRLILHLTEAEFKELSQSLPTIEFNLETLLLKSSGNEVITSIIFQ
ncbi:MAG: hypothetical protein A3E87_05080 [Gammaproteobacteria bacterium RIFCSPHIGHO2_12_FULL_35_23]|nr:MAG: hypothetical protein A3E87_05080 [Gammaproteobacteria bacterium RIFCSPHIGHO2_12_FULL_35_23]